MARSSQTNWHSEGGKLYLCESLIDKFNHYLACPSCCKSLAEKAPLPYQDAHAFNRDSGGRSPKGTTRRYWSCRVAKSPRPTLSCKMFPVSEMLGICFTQLTVEHFEQSVCTITELHDIGRRENLGLESWVMKHRQRLPGGASLPATAIHVKPAVIHVDMMSDPPPTKRKAEDPTGETPTKASRHARCSQKARDPSGESSLPRRPRSPKATAPLPRLIGQAFDLQGRIDHHTQELSAAQTDLRSLLKAIEAHTSRLSTPPDSPASTPSSPPPPPPSSAPSSSTSASTSTTSTLAFVPPGKGKNRASIEVTWIYAGCLVPDPREMSPKEVHDAILHEAAKVYDAKVLGRIIWARQLSDEDKTVELTVYASDVQRFYDIWVAKLDDDSVQLNLHDSLRDLHNPRYWPALLATASNPEKVDGRTLIRRHDVRQLAAAFQVCGSKLVRQYLTQLCAVWEESDLLYHEVGAYRERTGMKFPDRA
jgi:hypothetical protein